MAITEDDRLRLRLRLIEAIGEDAATVLMEAVPAVDYSQLATKADLDLAIRELRTEMNQRFVGHDQQFVSIERRFAQIDQRFAQIDQRFAEAEVNRARDLRIMVTTQIGSMLGLAGLLLSFG